MKKNLLMLAAFISLYVVGQKKEDIAPDVSKMIQANSQLDFETVMDYTYPVLFDFAPKEMLVEMMKESYDNPMMTITFKIENDIKLDISDVKLIRDGHYALVKFPSRMIMTFKNPLPEENINMMIEGMKSNLKAEKIEFIKEENALHVDLISETIAIFDKHTENTWKFMNYQKEQKEQLFEIIHPEVFESLGL